MHEKSLFLAIAMHLNSYICFENSTTPSNISLITIIERQKGVSLKMSHLQKGLELRPFPVVTETCHNT